MQTEWILLRTHARDDLILASVWAYVMDDKLAPGGETDSHLNQGYATFTRIDFCMLSILYVYHHSWYVKFAHLRRDIGSHQCTHNYAYDAFAMARIEETMISNHQRISFKRDLSGQLRSVWKTRHVCMCQGSDAVCACAGVQVPTLHIVSTLLIWVVLKWHLPCIHCREREIERERDSAHVVWENN